MNFPVPKIFAHYLPQFHRIPENSEWWGKGFTEWTNVARAKPLFPGHNQPNLPADLGFYDLTNVEVMREQATLAKKYGVDGFNFYFYWFNGRRILESPVQRFLDSNIKHEFSLTWANESWSRRWDGSDKEVLLAQEYGKDFEAQIFSDLLPYLKDKRYLRVNDEPVLSIYRAQDLPDPEGSINKLKSEALRAGFRGLHVIAVESFGLDSPKQVGADALMEFPPHGLPPQVAKNKIRGTVANFTGRFLDYEKAVYYSVAKPQQDFLHYRGLIPSWDNTPRVGERASLFIGATPEHFQTWLTFLYALSIDRGQEILFINAWNEWAEGAHLEPNLLHGVAFLEAVKNAKQLGQHGFQALPDSEKHKLEALIPHQDFLTLTTTVSFLRREATLQNLSRAWEMYRLHGSVTKVLKLALQYFRSAVRPPSAEWAQKRIVFIESKKRQFRPSINAAFALHIYYPEFVSKAEALVGRSPEGSHFYFSTSNEEIRQKLLDKFSGNSDVRLTPNIGRNFGPLLVEFGAELMKHDVVFHLHSKRSLHSNSVTAAEWGDMLWSSLSASQNTIDRILWLFEDNPKLGIVYPDVTKFVRKSNFSWTLNYAQAKRWLNNNKFDIPADPISFPAGGMAAFRTAAISQLLQQDWAYSDFPPELGQVDGTTQHMVERLLGVLPLLNGFEHGVYSPSADNFSSCLDSLS